jgi:hypothetical protein
MNSRPEAAGEFEIDHALRNVSGCTEDHHGTGRRDTIFRWRIVVFIFIKFVQPSARHHLDSLSWR